MLPVEEVVEEEKPVKAVKKVAKKVAAKKVAKVPAKKKKAPRQPSKRASVPPGTDLSTLSLADAVKFLSLPRELGIHPSTGKMVSANTGRFGPYVAHDGEFRSIKKADPYTITLDEALTIIAEPKQPPKGVDIVREIGKHPKTGKTIILYKSKQGLFFKKGLRRIYLPESAKPDEITPDEAAEYLK